KYTLWSPKSENGSIWRGSGLTPITISSLVGVGAVDVAQRHDSGVVDQDVEGAEALDGGGDRGAAVILERHVQLQRQRAVAELPGELRPAGRSAWRLLGHVARGDQVAFGSRL